MDSPPSSWCILNLDRQTRALVAKEGDLYLVDHGGQYQEQVAKLYEMHFRFDSVDYYLIEFAKGTAKHFIHSRCVLRLEQSSQ